MWRHHGHIEVRMNGKKRLISKKDAFKGINPFAVASAAAGGSQPANPDQPGPPGSEPRSPVEWLARASGCDNSDIEQQENAGADLVAEGPGLPGADHAAAAGAGTRPLQGIFLAGDPGTAPAGTSPDADAGGPETDSDSEDGVEIDPMATGRPQLQQAFQQQRVSILLQQKGAIQAERKSYEPRLKDIQHFHCTGDCHSVQPFQCVESRRPVAVKVFTPIAMQQLQLHDLQCTVCGKVADLSPLHFGCVPSSAGAFTPANFKSDATPIWFTFPFLQLADALTSSPGGTMAVHALVQAYTSVWRTSLQVSSLQRPTLPPNHGGCSVSGQSDGSRASAGGSPPDSHGAFQLQQLPAGYGDADALPSAKVMEEHLAAALREYQYLLKMAVDLVESLEGWPTGPNLPCAACLPLLLQLSFDMCFKLKLPKRKGQPETYPQPDNTRVIASNAEVMRRVEEVEAVVKQPQDQQAAQACCCAAAAIPARVPADISSSSSSAGAAAGSSTAADGVPALAPAAADAAGCSNFAADQLMARESSKLMITGLGVVACRHGHVFGMINSFTGEKHAYAIVALWFVLLANLRVNCWWYDINCRWMPTLLKWLHQQDEDTRAAVSGMWLPVPPWHLLAHMMSCRIKHGHLHMEGVGRGTGEVCERVNAWLGPHGHQTKYMRGMNREARLERVTLVHTLSLDLRLPVVLRNMVLRVVLEQEETAKKLQQEEAVLSSLLGPVAPEGVKQAVNCLVEAAGTRLLEPAAKLKLTWRAEYAKARLVIEADKRQAQGSSDPDNPSVPISMLCSSAKASSSALTQSAVAAAWKTVQQHAAHFGAEAPSTAHPDVKQGLMEFVCSSVLTAIEELLRLLSQGRYADLLATQLSQNKAAQRKAIKLKQRTWQQAQSKHKTLRSWCQWAESLDSNSILLWDADFLAKLQQVIARELSDLQSSTWVGGVSPALGGSGADAAALQVYLLRAQKQRLQEELQLLGSEQQRLMEVLQTRVCVLQRELQDTVQSSDRVDGTVAGRRYLLLLELQRARATLAEARKLSSTQGVQAAGRLLMEADPAAAAAAALEMMDPIEGEGGEGAAAEE